PEQLVHHLLVRREDALLLGRVRAAAVVHRQVRQLVLERLDDLAAPPNVSLRQPPVRQLVAPAQRVVPAQRIQRAQLLAVLLRELLQLVRRSLAAPPPPLLGQRTQLLDQIVHLG